MKKVLISFFLILLTCAALKAEVATPHPVTMRQPDGSTITLRLHGDEFCSWYTDLSGRGLYQQGSDGWWRPVRGAGPSRAMRSAAKALRSERDAMLTRKKSGIGFGEKRFLVILVEWSDQKFQAGAPDYFRRALNQQGFTDGGSVGSARDYYQDASYGRFQPTFDVLGPVTLSRKHDQWPEGDNNDKHYEMARTMVREAVAQLDDEVDFSVYDLDDDGYMDSIYMFFPGYAQSNGGGTDTIWPHAWGVYSNTLYDGVRIGAYACSSELRGNTGTDLQGIGTFCHEFGHVLGLPDLYDTDYEDNGQAFHPSSWNLMASGNHNSQGLIPPRLSSYERYLLGYITEVKELAANQDVRIAGLSNPVFHVIPTLNEGEFFLPEVRDGTVWDSPLPAGMIIYHIDRSKNLVGGVQAKDRWDAGSGINVYSEHPCGYILIPDKTLRPNNQYAIDDPSKGNNYYQLWVFPKPQGEPYGVSYNVTEYELKGWDGSNPFVLKEIAYAQGVASFHLSRGQRSVTGIVQDAQTGAVLRNAVVLISEVSAKPARFVRRPLSLAATRAEARYEAVTDYEGRFNISLEEDFPTRMLLSVFATGYHPYHSEEEGWSVNKRIEADPVIKGGLEEGLTKANYPLSYVRKFGVKERNDYVVAQRFRAEELKDYAGGVITSIAFCTNATGEEVWVFVDYGTRERAYARQIKNVKDGANTYGTVNTWNLSSAGVTVPEGEDLYVGYMIRQANAEYPIITDASDSKEGGLVLSYGFSTTTPPSADDWTDVNFDLDWGMGNALISFTVEAPYLLDSDATLKELGINYIDLPSRELSSGETLPLKLVTCPTEKPTEVLWYYDGYPLEEASVKLSAGTHTISARIRYQDGKKDLLETQIVVR